MKIGDRERHINPGRNNGMILVEGVKTDAQNKEMRWLEVVKGDCAITFANCHQAWTEDGSTYPRKWTLRGAAKLTIRDSVNLFGLESFVLERKGESQRPNAARVDRVDDGPLALPSAGLPPPGRRADRRCRRLTAVDATLSAGRSLCLWSSPGFAGNPCSDDESR